ncbi:Transcriptional regulator, TetR family [Actinokineospora spheciospongiae]|uniref:Transcriptional regulator, TetR family n=1 Tax=Actinokineospora spheciospongiae TaxID=909613 RepID=W7IJ50_9PSEU|nr:TetR/AcrR family transcriptional regulator [Actinokineospora spheciospongiae]EWC60343.1 Transcriptional regulator, TetR family [Actinokineospora spheciospongiae]PWW52652.1 TetR family transcriptional regulator [Actinokineospora spheciospongiae]
MSRLTRVESQTRNRESLLRTARQMFLADGYHATSIARIAETAGFSTGAVYSNFEGKAEIALLVLRDIHGEQLGALRAMIAEPLELDEQLDRLREWANGAMTCGWPRLELEFALDARTEDALVRVEADRQRSTVDFLTEVIEQRLTAIGADTGAVPVRLLVEAGVNLAIGLATRRVIDPKVTADSLVDIIRTTLAVIPRHPVKD